MRLFSLIGVLAILGAIPILPSRAEAGGDIWSVHTRAAHGRGRIVATRIRDGARRAFTLALTTTGVTASPAICTTPDGRAAVAWVDARAGRYRLRVSVFERGGWSRPESVAESTSPLTTPAAAFSGESGLWLAWTRFDGEDDEIVVARRAKGTSRGRWTLTENSVPDILPAIIARADGGVELIWQGFDGRAYSLRKSVFNGQAWREAPMDAAVRSPQEAFTAGEAAGEAPPEAARTAASFLGREGDGPAKIAWSDERGSWSAPALALSAPRDGAVGAPPSIPCPTGLLGCAGNDRTIFMAIGDSTTYGRGSSRNGPPTDYPTRLENLLKGPWVARNRGIPSDTSAGVLSRIDDDLNRCRPGLTILMIGVNDAFLGLSSDTILFNINEAASRVVAHGGKILLATTTPVIPEELPGSYTKLSILNYKILKLASEKGYPCVNLWNTFQKQPAWRTALFSSENHPNNAGYELMATQFRTAIVLKGLLNGPADWASFAPLSPGQLYAAGNAPAAVPLLSDKSSPLAATGTSAVAAADLDGDGFDELAVVVGDKTQSVFAYSAPATGVSSEELRSQVVLLGTGSPAMTAGGRITHLFGLDLDGDAREELGLVRWIQSQGVQRLEVWRAFQPGQTDPVRLLTDSHYLPANGRIRDISSFRADDDAPSEVAVLAERSPSGQQIVFVFDHLPADGSAPTGLTAPVLYVNRWTWPSDLLRLTGQDIDGDARDELVLLKLNPSSCNDSLEAWKLPAFPAFTEETSRPRIRARDRWARVKGGQQFAIQPLVLRDGVTGEPDATLSIWRVR